MLKKSASFVLASLKPSTYRRKYATAFRSLRPCWTAILNFLQELFEGFKRGLFREGPFAIPASDEVDGFTDRHGRPEIQAYPPMVARGAGDFFEPVGDIRLGAQVELHVGVNREAIEALLADPPPLAVWLHKSVIDAKVGFLTNGTFDSRQAGFDFLNGRSGHGNWPPGGV
jgi:hypothetical protein